MRKTKVVEVFPRAPGHLSDSSRAIWEAIGPEHIRTAGRRVLFQVALESLDLAAEARTARASDALMTKSKRTGTPHAHPMITTERDAMRRFIECWKLLGLEFQAKSIKEEWGIG